jgi:hypothetical protein
MAAMSFLDPKAHQIHEPFMDQVEALHAEASRMRTGASCRPMRSSAGPWRSSPPACASPRCAPRSTTACTPRGRRAIAELARRFQSALLERRAEFNHSDPQIAIEVCFRMVFATLSRQTMFGATFESSVEVGRDRLVRDLGLACVALLMHTPATEA